MNCRIEDLAISAARHFNPHRNNIVTIIDQGAFHDQRNVLVAKYFQALRRERNNLLRMQGLTRECKDFF